jgi:ElaB/YqjD/DUF883 family membrane-anchored ribosome-binding protein
MQRPITPVKSEVVPRPGGDSEVQKSHPSFGMLGFSRVSGGKTRLFGSEIETPHVIRMRVVPAKENWHLSQKWFHGSIAPVIEVDLTPAQFAEAISCMNIGDGVPCTIRELVPLKGVEPGMVPDFRDEDTVTANIIEDVKADVADVVNRINQLVKDVDEALTGVSGVKREKILGALKRIQQQLHSNMPFVLTQYREAIETMQAHAKAEMDAVLLHAITRLGLKSLAQLTAASEDAPREEEA